MSIHEIPYLGVAYSKNTTSLFDVEDYPRIVVSGSSLHIRFAVKVDDEGLEGLNIHPGDYLIFSQTGWPNQENKICFLRFGDEVIIRSICGIFDTEPLLCTTGDRYPSFKAHRNDFIVQGQLVGKISPENVEWAQKTQEEYWG